MNTAVILAFITALTPYIPLALFGVKTAKETAVWGFKTLSNMMEEGRDPTEDEWARVRKTRADLLAKLNSDTF